MLYTARQGTRYAQGAVPRKGNRPKGKRRTQLHILQGLPNIGSEKARALLDTFGSVEAVLTANEDALQQVNGIGKQTAQAIRWAVQEETASYGENQ